MPRWGHWESVLWCQGELAGGKPGSHHETKVGQLGLWLKQEGPPNCRIPDLPFLPSPAIDWKIWKALYLCGWLVVCHICNSSDVTLAFVDAQVIPPFSREETDDTDKTDETDGTDDTDDRDDTDDTVQTCWKYRKYLRYRRYRKYRKYRKYRMNSKYRKYRRYRRYRKYRKYRKNRKYRRYWERTKDTKG